MKLREGLKVQIKRETKKGLKECLAYYFECNGIQYGFIEDKLDSRFYAIHLDTGMSACEVENDTSQKKGFELLKEKVKQIPVQDLKKVLPKVKKDMQAKGYDFPLN